MNTGGGWTVEEGKTKRMHRARRKHGVNGERREGRGGRGRQEGGECGWNGGKSKREEECSSARARARDVGRGRKNTVREGLVARRASERADRASERARLARRCTVKGVS